MLRDYLQNRIFKRITGASRFIMENNPPSVDNLHVKFQNINELGIYLHIPFCRYICPYCPYNKELYQDDLVKRYTASVIKEIDYYASIAGSRPVTSFYIGGGTPTTMLGNGIEQIINHIYKSFNMKCHVHIESHPNDLSQENMNILKSLGVKYLSVGVEALQDRHLNTLNRSYSASEVKQAVDRAVNTGFECVNVDFIFALPGQTYKEIEQAGNGLVSMGVQQAATYPLFRFPYTKMGQNSIKNESGIPLLLKRRKMLSILENIFYDSGFYRSSVWAFTRKGTEKYCSVTVPLYLGLGASGGSYLNDIFFLNTFNVTEYIKSLEQNKIPVALSVDLTENMQMAGWLYWRIYETRFRKNDFEKRFKTSFDSKYGKEMKFLSRIGFLKDDGQQIVLTDKGAYWLHAFEDWFSIDFISKLWGSSKNIPWPEKVVLTGS
ncbi:MAG: coproporphyrinogen-III oxidase family protein [Bacteroidia bacterium]|jgi:oxygen-independent coproporphyrinogen-3 oxidase|nr:coproporphyrinogen-III oxidase family protein [Bacteroidia bacterium]